MDDGRRQLLAGRCCELSEEHWPSLAMGREQFFGQIAVFNGDASPSGCGLQPELNLGGAWRNRRRLSMSPGNDDSFGPLKFEVSTANRYAVDVEGELPTWSGVEHGVVAYPFDHRFRVRKIVEDAYRWRGDVD